VRRILRLLRNEVIKAGNGRLALIGVAVSCLICLILFTTLRPQEVGALNGWIFTQMVMLTVFTEMGVVFAALFAAQLVAEETGSGTIRLGLCAPVRRYEYFLAKVLAAHLYMMALTVIVLAVTVALGSLRHDFGPIGDTVGVVYGVSQACRCLAVTVALTWLPLGAVVMFALLISVSATRAGVAMGTTLAAIILLETLKHLIGIGPWLFTNYLPFPWVVFHEMAQGVDYRWFPELWKMLAVCGSTWGLAFAAALWRFSRRDLNV
jgi:ABC-type transport system involved in multi-copper enzyme maturation permease subunit